MFLSTSSPLNVSSSETIDTTASYFEVLLDDPIELEDFNIELITANVTKENNTINITTSDRVMTVRLGSSKVGDYYKMSIDAKEYDHTEALSAAIASKLNDVMPNNSLKNFVGTTVGGPPTKVVITYDPATTPKPAGTSVQLIKSENIDSIGYSPTFTPATGAGESATLTLNYGGGNNNFNEPITTSSGFEPGEEYSIRPMDIGEEEPDAITFVGVDGVSVFENGGEQSAILKPIEVFSTSVYLVENTFYTIESNSEDFEEELYGDFAFQEYRGQTNRQLNGFCIGLPGPSTDVRGLPYTKPRRIAGPVNTVTPGTAGYSPVETRACRMTWGGNIIYTLPGSAKRGFVLDSNLLLPNGVAHTTMTKVGSAVSEDARMRLSINPLIQGLPQQNASGVIEQTVMNTSGLDPVTGILFSRTATGINNNAGGVANITYTVGSVGQFNTQYGAGSPFISTNTQGLANGIYKLPLYKITQVSATTGQITEAILTDSGENIGQINPGVDNTYLYFNDPATFVITDQGALTDAEVLEGLVNQARPLPANIFDTATAQEVPTKKFTYLPTRFSLINDQIYKAFLQGVSDGNYSNTGEAQFPADLAIEITPENTDDATGPDYIGVTIYQFQPESGPNNNNENRIYERVIEGPGVGFGEKVVFEASPGTWNTYTYTSTNIPPVAPPLNPTNWTTDFKLDASSRLKLDLRVVGGYEQQIIMSFSKDGGTTFQEDQTIMETYTNAEFEDMKLTMKDRNFPYHLGISTYPGSNISGGSGINEILIKGNYTEYPLKLFGTQQLRQSDFNRANSLSNPGVVQPDIFEFPVSSAAAGIDITTVTTAGKPQIALKTSPNYIASSTPTATGQVPLSDKFPETVAYLGIPAGLFSAYFIAANFGGAGTAIFTGDRGATTLSRLAAFAIELVNLPFKGYITKTLGLGNNTPVLTNGTGNSSQIVGIVPSIQTENSSNNFTVFRYTPNFSQSVHCKLPSPTFFYNFVIRIRDLLTGEVVKDLRNPSQFTFRITKNEKK